MNDWTSQRIWWMRSEWRWTLAGNQNVISLLQIRNWDTTYTSLTWAYTGRHDKQADGKREKRREKERQQWQLTANTNIEMRSKPCQYLAKKKKETETETKWNWKMQVVRRCRAAVKCGNVAVTQDSAQCPVNWPIIGIWNMLYLSHTFYLPCPGRTCIVRTVTFSYARRQCTLFQGNTTCSNCKTNPNWEQKLSPNLFHKRYTHLYFTLRS